METFVGCGGAHLGFKQNGFESLLVNDIDKNMIDTLLSNKCITEDSAYTGPIEKLTNEIILNKKINYALQMEEMRMVVLMMII